MISGKYFPKDNPGITCDRFMAVKSVKISSTERRDEHTVVVNMDTTAIDMSECSDAEICCSRTDRLGLSGSRGDAPLILLTVSEPRMQHALPSLT